VASNFDGRGASVPSRHREPHLQAASSDRGHYGCHLGKAARHRLHLDWQVAEPEAVDDHLGGIPIDFSRGRAWEHDYVHRRRQRASVVGNRHTAAITDRRNGRLPHAAKFCASYSQRQLARVPGGLFGAHGVGDGHTLGALVVPTRVSVGPGRAVGADIDVVGGELARGTLSTVAARVRCARWNAGAARTQCWHDRWWRRRHKSGWRWRRVGRRRRWQLRYKRRVCWRGRRRVQRRRRR